MPRPINPEISKRIVESALAELGKNPPDKINLRALAKLAGVSPTTIYFYFASKDELFERIKFDAMAELAARVDLAIGPETDPVRSLKILVRAFAAWCRDRPYLAKLLMEELPPKENLDQAAYALYYGFFLRAQALMDKAQATLNIAHPMLDCSVMQSAIWGIVSQFRSKRVHPDYWRDCGPLVDRLIEIYFGKEN